MGLECLPEVNEGFDLPGSVEIFVYVLHREAPSLWPPDTCAVFT